MGNTPTRADEGDLGIERENVRGDESDVSPTAKEIEVGCVSGDNWRDSNGQKQARTARRAK